MVHLLGSRVPVKGLGERNGQTSMIYTLLSRSRHTRAQQIDLNPTVWLS